MAENPSSRDRTFEALDFIINVLKEHEKTLDTSIQGLEKVTQQRIDLGIPEKKLEEIEQKIEGLQKEVAKLAGHLLSTPQKQSAPERQQNSTTDEARFVVPTVVQSVPTAVLRCNLWEDFRLLTKNSQTLFFSSKQEDNSIQAQAIKGNQLITYTGALPDLSIILRTWLSQKLGIMEQNIFEGSIE